MNSGCIDESMVIRLKKYFAQKDISVWGGFGVIYNSFGHKYDKKTRKIFRISNNEKIIILSLTGTPQWCVAITNEYMYCYESFFVRNQHLSIDSSNWNEYSTKFPETFTIGAGQIFKIPLRDILNVNRKRVKKLTIWNIELINNKSCNVIITQNHTLLLAHFFKYLLDLEFGKKWLISKAKQYEDILDYDSAIKIYKEIGMDNEIKRIRQLLRDESQVQISQKVVHGDEISATTIQDSVVSRSTIGTTKDDSDIISKIRELSQMRDDGILTDEQFEAAKEKLLE